MSPRAMQRWTLGLVVLHSTAALVLGFWPWPDALDAAIAWWVVLSLAYGTIPVFGWLGANSRGGRT